MYHRYLSASRDTVRLSCLLPWYYSGVTAETSFILLLGVTLKRFNVLYRIKDLRPLFPDARVQLYVRESILLFKACFSAICLCLDFFRECRCLILLQVTTKYNASVVTVLYFSKQFRSNLCQCHFILSKSSTIRNVKFGIAFSLSMLFLSVSNQKILKMRFI